MLSRTTGMRAARKIVTGKTWQIVVLVNPVQVAAAATAAHLSAVQSGFAVPKEQSNVGSW